MSTEAEKAPLIPCTPGEPLTATPAVLQRLLAVIEDEIIPKTAAEVGAGNKVFGAAILDGRDFDAGDTKLPTVLAETNRETLCPLYHGEIWTIKQWSEAIPQEGKPAPQDSVFLSTHEPCCLCISAIVWTGFKRVFYLFPYEATRDQGIPHDINIMQELWQVPRYAQCNKFCTSVGILDLIEACPDGDEKTKLRETVARITARYDQLSHQYHSEKAANPKNTLAFG